MGSLRPWQAVTLASVLLAGAIGAVLFFVLRGDSNGVTTMEIGGELVEVQHLPYVRDVVAFPLPTVAMPEGVGGAAAGEPPWMEELGYFLRGLALRGGRFLIVTRYDREPGERCLTLVVDGTVIEASVCGGERGEQPRPLVLRSSTLLAVDTPPPAAVVAEFGGVYRTIERGFVYFDDTADAEGAVRYFNAAGEQISADGRAALPEDVALVGSQGLEALKDASGSSSTEAAPEGIAAEVERIRERDRIDRMNRWPLEIELDERVGECMEARGFDYVITVTREPRPLLPESDLREIFEYAAQLTPGSYSYRSAFGYGVSTLDAYTYVALGPAPGSVTSGSLSVAESEAYNDALWGTQSRAGCHEIAADELGYNAAEDREIELSFALRLALQRAGGLDAHTTAEQQWVECTQALGFGFEHPSEVPRHFEEELFDLPGEYWEDDGDLIEGNPGNEVLAGSQGGSDSIFDPVALALLQAEEIDTARRLTRCDSAFAEATQETVNRLAEEILLGTPSGLGPDDGTPWSVGPPLPSDAVVEDLPRIDDDTVPEVSERLGRVEASLTLPDGRKLLRTAGVGDYQGCFALVAPVGGFSSCRGSGPKGWSDAHVMTAAGLLAVTGLPAEAVVAEFAGVYRRIENGFAYFDDIDSEMRDGVRYYAADGTQISGIVRKRG